MEAVFAARRLPRPPAAVAADGLRRGDAAVRLRQAGHALRPRDRRALRGARGLRLQGLPVRARRRRRRPRPERGGARDVAARSSTGCRRWPSAPAARRSPTRSSRTDGAWRSPIAKFLCRGADRRRQRARSRRSAGDLLFFSADTAAVAANVARLAPPRARPSASASSPRASTTSLWIVDWPMFEPTDGGGLTAIHHPFTAPTGSFDDPARAALARLRPRARRHRDRRRLDPHPHPRGPAAGLRGARASSRGGAGALRLPARRDALRRPAARRASRWASTGSSRILAGRDSIRDVIAFPKTASGGDPLTGAPAPVEAGPLRELAVASLVEPPPGSSRAAGAADRGRAWNSCPAPTRSPWARSSSSPSRGSWCSSPATTSRSTRATAAAAPPPPRPPPGSLASARRRQGHGAVAQSGASAQATEGAAATAGEPAPAARSRRRPAGRRATATAAPRR